MDTPSWNRVKKVIDAALDQEPAERAEFVRLACGDDGALGVEVRSLLAAIEQAGTFIDRPALQSLSASAAWTATPTREAAFRALQPGDSLGPHTILEFVGAGGMGEVYRARDDRLNRDVALKVLPEAFAADADRLTRFKREAQALASLNHPSVAAIYGLEEFERGQALVLELVEGPTLADCIASAPIPLNEGLVIATQIAEGLEAAHGRGIVHRDLKPANIKLRPDGKVKILDFGLAKALDPLDASAVASGLDSVTSSVTARSGVIIGTAAYMSPEQARGKAVDTRADVWAFGCVLYETLAGRPAFEGETVQDTLAAVLAHEPDWSLLPAETPAGVMRLLRRCLEKNPERRLHDIADARIEIEDADPATPIVVRAGRRRVAVWVLAAAAAVAFVLTAWNSLRTESLAPAATPTVRRLLIGLPDAQPLARAASMPLGLGQPSIAITPDGTRLAYVLEHQGVRRLYLRGLDQFDAAPIQHTEGAFGPFFSPDGRWIGFFAANRLKKVAASGGTPITLCDAPNPHGGSWGTDGTILFSTDEGRRPVRVRETGGTCQRVPLKDNRGSWLQPDILPNGRAAVVSNPLLGIGVLSLDSGEFRVLVEGGSGGRYAPSGHLVFARAGALLAAPFDLERQTINGPSTVILEGVRMDGQPAVAQAVFSRDGTLVYAPGGAANDATRPVWVDRKGKVQPVGMPPGSYRSFSLSPDGRRLAIAIGDPRSDLWVQDLERGTLTRLTSSGNNVGPIWTPDGTRVVFTDLTGGRRAFWTQADGSGEPEPLFANGNRGAVGSFWPNGDIRAFVRGGPDTGLDLWVGPLKGTEAPQPFLRTRFTEVAPRFSPDGRWIVYVSDESGQYDVYVRPYPPGPGKWQVSTAGGEEGIWSRDGKELFYRNGSKWMSVDVRLAPEFKLETPRLLFEGPYVNVGGLSYDVDPDGLRFLLLEPAEHDVAPVTQLNVVLDWFEEVRQKTRRSERP